MTCIRLQSRLIINLNKGLAYVDLNSKLRAMRTVLAFGWNWTAWQNRTQDNQSMPERLTTV